MRVHPGARRPGLVGRLEDGSFKVAVAEPPEGGRANAAVVGLVAAALGLRPRQVRVVRGAAARVKLLEIEGLGEGEMARRLAAALDEGGHGQ